MGGSAAGEAAAPPYETPRTKRTLVADDLDGAVDEAVVDLGVRRLVHEARADLVKGRNRACHLGGGGRRDLVRATRGASVAQAGRTKKPAPNAEMNVVA